LRPSPRIASFAVLENAVMRLILFLSVLWFCLPGCGSNNDFVTEDRLANGLVIVLPGIEGESPFNHDIRDGLLDANVSSAIMIYRWGRPIPIAGPIINQMDVLGNRIEGRRIAQVIADYQDSHAGKPVYLVGHSGGGGVAVFAAEAMPEGRKVDGLILLSASISCDYDLNKALLHCKNGIVNFYSRGDVGFLVIGTTVAGNVDGTHGPAAGQKKFQKNFDRLWQVEVMDDGEAAHIAATRSTYVATNVARWVLESQWPIK
jgi:pimeloyl-ACP methyl ester carboxylesterase